MSWKVTLPFQQSQIAPTVTDCENRANEKVENKSFGNGMVVLGTTSHLRKLTWKMKIEAGTSKAKGRLPLISL